MASMVGREEVRKWETIGEAGDVSIFEAGRLSRSFSFSSVSTDIGLGTRATKKQIVVKVDNIM